VLNENLMAAKLETLTERLKLVSAENYQAANDLIVAIEKNKGQIKRALLKGKKK